MKKMLYEFVKIENYVCAYDTGKDVILTTSKYSDGSRKTSAELIPNYRIAIKNHDNNGNVKYKIVPTNTDERVKALLLSSEEKSNQIRRLKNLRAQEQEKNKEQQETIFKLKEKIKSLQQELAKTKKGGLSVVKGQGGELSEAKPEKKGLLSIFKG